MLKDMTSSIDEYLSKLFSELAKHYPQAPAAGASARMKKSIVEFNRIQD
jgi:hypothetical protein